MTMAHPTSPSRPFGTMLTAMVTPFTADGAVDLEAAVSLATHLVDVGHDGLVLNGTTGESPTTHAPEKADLVRAVVDAVGDRAVVVAGAGSNDTDHSIRMAEQSAAAGAHGLLVVSPYYSRPSQEGIVQHTVAIADSTDLPVMVYDIPGRSGVRLTGDTYARLAEHEKIVAVKDATGDVYAAAQHISRTGLAWYSGDDALYLAFLAHGAVGLVSVVGHVVGRELVEIGAAFQAGDHARATGLFVGIVPVIDAVMGGGFGVVMIKSALVALGLVPDGRLRLPQVDATPAEAAAVREALRTVGLLDGPTSR
ncbi:dihydrodipicolinate synthase [Sanguibacter keddieii DSM 10542]|uniref:4-hydroxy-tetrahydrodipicolinate synthase n=2 Tax=Sanguibacter keddieii TaxID=60920 RepID=D1BJ50_SANKS|nr:dihydrodipicolinate synthase [Sanguibacter keddieii DSM 10542]